MGCLARSVNHWQTFVLIPHRTRSGALRGDSDRVGVGPIADETIPHFLREGEELRLIAFELPNVLPVGENVYRGSSVFATNATFTFSLIPMDKLYFC